MTLLSDCLTITRVGTYERCPRQWGYIYAAGLRMRPNWAMVGGSAMDATLNRHHGDRIRGSPEIRGSAMTDFFVETFRRLACKEDPIGERSGDIESDGTRLLSIYEREVTPQVEPIAVQREVTIPIGEKTYLGHVDLIRQAEDGARVVTDHKFVSRTPSTDAASKSLQLRAYDLGVDDPAHRVELTCLIRLKGKPCVSTLPHIVSPQDRREVIDKFRKTALLIDTVVFPQADPASWMCSPTSCGFWPICRGRTAGPLPIPGERE